MLDLNHLRKTHSVVTVAEYLELNGMPPSIEWPNGAWHRENYSNGGRLSLHVIPNKEYDLSPIVRVENLPKHPAGNENSTISKILYDKLGEKRIAIDLTEAGNILKAHVEFAGDDQLEAALRENGWEVLHTFSAV
jgi:hypothetical protein